MQAPHICVTVFSRGLLNHLVTRLYFEDEPTNAADPVLQYVPDDRRTTLLARRELVAAAWSSTVLISFCKARARRRFSTCDGARSEPILERLRHMSEPTDVLFSTPGMSAAFSSEAHVRGMLAFEAALARAEARAGIIPREAADAIASSCRVELFDVAALYREGAVAGTPAIPLVRMLTARVEGSGGEAGKFVHWGATSQDAIDTALMLQMRDGLDLLAGALLGVCEVCARLAEEHRQTLIAGRTLLQQALPITFGLKAARWLSLALRLAHSLRTHRERTLAVQLGGATGTLAALGDKGLRVVEYLAEELGLPEPDLPWHTERDRVAGIAATLGVVAGAMEKIAGDVVLLAQSELGRGVGRRRARKRGVVRHAAEAQPGRRDDGDQHRRAWLLGLSR